MTFLFINNNKKKDFEALSSELGTRRNIRIEISSDTPLKVPLRRQHSSRCKENYKLGREM
jgi:hypothetical protein